MLFGAACLLIVLTPLQEPDPAAPEKKLDAGALSAFTFRPIGPALMSGRIADLAVDPERPNTWYAAAGSGGLWKTVNAGTTWEPIFEGQSSYSIGCVTISPHDRNVIWVGSGEAVGGRHVGWGDGVYRSRDGGRSFENLGLKATEHVAKIVVDPRDPDLVYVAAQGPLWSAGGERGLYKTTDGGRSWRAILAAGPYTGVTDVALDPRNPDVIYAATHQRQRTVWALINGGPESGIHKSTDGGQSWTELKQGLPGGDKGKIGLALSPQDPNVVYATIELAGGEGGFWRSDNGGASWSKQSDYVSGGTGPHYYQELWADPHRAGSVYQANVVLGRTDDGGATWQGIGNDHKHVDNHAVAFHPADPDFLLVGCDGGLYVSRDRGVTFQFFANLPLTQFYKVDVDYDWPVYHVVGGTQDNATQYGPARTLTAQGVTNADWRVLIGGDGHDCAIDPSNPDVVYCESQEGYLQRFDRLTGEAIDIRPRPASGEEDFRFNWDSPIHLSPHSISRVYFGSKVLHRSDDHGSSWTTISPDLSRGENRLTLKIMDRVWSVDALWDLRAMSQYGNVTSISESPVVEGLIYAGTDDGLIQVTEDGGRTWRRCDKMGETPEYAFVNDVKADRFDPDVVYAVLDRHKTGDFSPYVVRSADRGRTWTSIAGDLPARHVAWRIIQDHVKPELLFLGTEYGLFCSLSGGGAWLKMSGGLPTIPCRDLEIQRRENDLVVATFGRGFYVLDDFAPLRELSEERLAEEFLLFAPRPALQFVPNDLLGGAKGSQGDSFFSTPNPDYGAVFTYYLRDPLRSLKAQRQEAEGKLKKEGADVPLPSWEALKAEERERPPELWLDVLAADGALVSRVSCSTGAGLHRSSWDLNFAESAARGGRRAPPGVYTARAYRRQGETTTPLGEPVSFEVKSVGAPALPGMDRAALLAFQEQLLDLQRQVQGTRRVLDASLAEVREMLDLLRGDRRAEADWLEEARRLEIALLDAQERLAGDSLPARYGAETKPAILNRLQGTLFAVLGGTHGPTGTQQQQFEMAREDYAAVIDGIRQLVEEELATLKQTLDAAGLPWTRGRAIPR